MDLPHTAWQEFVAQKWSAVSPEVKQMFKSLQDIDAVFKCVAEQTTEADVDVLRGVADGYPVRKAAAHAALCRERGNCSFRRGDYGAAALHYSQGVCSSPRGSEQLSLCHANRSATLFRLRRYQEALGDITSALAHGYPPHLRPKLEGRRGQCLSQLSAGQRGEGNSKGPEGTHGPDVESSHNVELSRNGDDPTSHISPGVSVHFQPGKGRHLVATEGIAAGGLIMVERPYGCVLIPRTEVQGGCVAGKDATAAATFGEEDRRCHECLCETMSAVACEGCSYARYCSDPCRLRAWAEHHRWECPVGAELAVTGVMSQLALRVALKAGRENVRKAREMIGDGPEADSPAAERGHPSALHDGDAYAGIYALLHHLGRQSPELRFLCAVTVATLYLALRRSGPPPASWRRVRSTSATVGPEADGGEREGWAPEHWLLGSVVLRHMLQLRCNAQAVTALQDAGGPGCPSRVQATQEVRLASAVFPTLSLLNHSCRPNTSLAFSTPHPHPHPGAGAGAPPRGVTLSIRAADDIAAGQEILHCYGPHSSRMPSAERQRLLLDQYFFRCGCEACSPQQDPSSPPENPQLPGLQCCECRRPLQNCTDGRSGFVCLKPSCSRWVCSSEVSLRLQEVRGHLQQAVELLEADRPDEALLLLEAAPPQGAAMLSERHPLQGELSDALARTYATLGDWRRAADQLKRSTVAIRAQYGEQSVELGRQLFKLAQLHFNGGDPAEALAGIPGARRLLRLHCGPHCPEVQQLQAMEECLECLDSA